GAPRRACRRAIDGHHLRGTQCRSLDALLRIGSRDRLRRSSGRWRCVRELQRRERLVRHARAATVLDSNQPWILSREDQTMTHLASRRAGVLRFLPCCALLSIAACSFFDTNVTNPNAIEEKALGDA